MTVAGSRSPHALMTRDEIQDEIRDRRSVLPRAAVELNPIEIRREYPDRWPLDRWSGERKIQRDLRALGIRFVKQCLDCGKRVMRATRCLDCRRIEKQRERDRRVRAALRVLPSMAPTTLFLCESLRCGLMARACIDRQLKHVSPCGPACVQGTAVRRAVLAGKIDADDAAWLRAAVKSGLALPWLAKQYALPVVTVEDIRDGLVWRENDDIISRPRLPEARR